MEPITSSGSPARFTAAQGFRIFGRSGCTVRPMKHLGLTLMATLSILVGFGCSSDDVSSFDTYQECFDDRPLADLPVDKILACCLDTQIDGARPACGQSEPDCINYLTNNLSQFDASTVEVQDACAQYDDMLPAE